MKKSLYKDDPIAYKKKFFSNVSKPDENGCMNWLKSKNKGGYGLISLTVNGKRNYRAHRVSYIIKNGAVEDGLYILHKCNNPSCVNPEHLYAGTQRDNMQDMVSSGNHVGFKGKTHTLKERENISKRKKGSNHHIFGKKHSIESKKKMSESSIGDKNGMYGINHTETTKNKISLSKKVDTLIVFKQYKGIK